jgi:tellurite resistance protein
VKLDDSKLRDALAIIHPGPLSRDEAAAIIDVARFAASVDGRMDMKEMATVARLSKIVYSLSGDSGPPVPSTPVTLTQVMDVGGRLSTTSMRELAFASAYVIALADGKVVDEERTLGAQLTEALQIAPTRLEELTGLVDGVFAAA